MKQFYLAITLIFIAGNVQSNPLDPQHQKNFNTGMNLIIHNIVCYKCATGQWPKSLYEMKNNPAQCDTKYLNLKNSDGTKKNIPNMKFKVDEKEKIYQLVIAGEDADINNLTLKDNFSSFKLKKSKIQCEHNK